MSVERRVRRLGAGRPARLGALVLLAEALSVAGYALLAPGRVTDIRYVVYPFVWTNAGLLAVWATSPPETTLRRGAAAAGVAAAYFFGLAYLTGLVGFYPPGTDHGALAGLQVATSPPGWGPRVAYVAETFHVYFVPYRVVGYLSLSYLVYAALADAVPGALSGVLGVGACVGCTFPLVAPALAGLLGGAVGFAAVSDLSVDLSTALFCLALAALYVRPGVGSG
ncbi:MAG: hypothetical protein ABEJ04_06495 [Halobacteriaceae archaeon]